MEKENNKKSKKKLKKQAKITIFHTYIFVNASFLEIL